MENVNINNNLLLMFKSTASNSLMSDLLGKILEGEAIAPSPLCTLRAATEFITCSIGNTILRTTHDCIIIVNGYNKKRTVCFAPPPLPVLRYFSRNYFVAWPLWKRPTLYVVTVGRVTWRAGAERGIFCRRGGGGWWKKKKPNVRPIT